MENIKNLRKNIIKSLASNLSKNWLVRRIIDSNGKYYIEEINGHAQEVAYDRVSIELNRFIHTEGMNHEALVIVHKRRSTSSLNRNDFSKIITDFSETVRGVSSKYISRAGYISDALGLEPVLGGKEAPCKEWEHLLKNMPGSSSLLAKSVHMLFVGSDMKALIDMKEYAGLVDGKEIEGIYDSLPAISLNRSKASEKAWEATMIAKGASLSAVDKAISIMNSMSDDDKKPPYKENTLKLPWKKSASIQISLAKVKQVLDDELYGLDEVKNEVLTAIAGSLISSQGTFLPPRVLLHGTPGTGKTAIAKAIAKAMQIPFNMIAMNGISSAVSIVGVELCYASPQMGEIMKALTLSGVKNPLILLDEIEKSGHDEKYGDPLNALHQALDPDENKNFTDVYFGFPFDVSEVFFIATSNDISGLSESLLDRFLVIEVPEYSVQEKQAIMPYLIRQLVSERQLHCTPRFTASALVMMEKDLLPNSSLRQIKSSIWRMLCTGAFLSDDVVKFGQAPVIDEHSVEAVIGSAKIKKKHSMGFL